MRNGKTAALLLLLALCLLLSGCRIRLTGTVPQDVPSGTAETAAEETADAAAGAVQEAAETAAAAAEETAEAAAEAVEPEE